MAVLCEAGAALLFFGLLAQQPELAATGAAALAQLAELGYRVPTADDPVRVYPAGPTAVLESERGAAWRPGVITLRPYPSGTLGAGTYLRHDLFHEASYRTCRDGLPLWAEEAAAMRFSGELTGAVGREPASAADMDHLRDLVRLGAPLDAGGYRTLAGLVADHGWPLAPCARSASIEAALAAPTVRPTAAPSHLLVSLASGRVLEAGGDHTRRHPVGSLLKLVYAAALTGEVDADLGAELAASDTQRLLARRGACDWQRYRLLAAAAGQRFRPLTDAKPPAGGDETGWRALLGERDADGGFALEASLPELARVLRAALLFRPEVFGGLSLNGTVPGTTLHSRPGSERRVLRQLRAGAKTGTVSDRRGRPLVGHLMVAWPADDPAYLALFCTPGESGAAGMRRAAPLLTAWSERYDLAPARVRVRMMTLLTRASWQIVEQGPGFTRQTARGTRLQISLDGRFRIVSTARGSRSERCVTGILDHAPGDKQVELITDAESYADAVLSAEAQTMGREAQRALRAVIVWNARQAGSRHPGSASLCDSTHCMVFMGAPCDNSHRRGAATDPALLRLLGELSHTRHLPAWLPFAQGGVQPWQRTVAAGELARLVEETRVLDLRRERTRDGQVMVHLSYPQDEERVPCEVLRSRLQLPSCPETIREARDGGGWMFEGVGRGHGQGLSLERTQELGRKGWDAAALLRDAYDAFDGQGETQAPPDLP